jgi:hypothetical protein
VAYSTVSHFTTAVKDGSLHKQSVAVPLASRQKPWLEKLTNESYASVYKNTLKCMNDEICAEYFLRR